MEDRENSSPESLLAEGQFLAQNHVRVMDELLRSVSEPRGRTPRSSPRRLASRIANNQGTLREQRNRTYAAEVALQLYHLLTASEETGTRDGCARLPALHSHRTNAQAVRDQWRQVDVANASAPSTSRYRSHDVTESDTRSPWGDGPHDGADLAEQPRKAWAGGCSLPPNDDDVAFPCMQESPLHKAKTVPGVRQAALRATCEADTMDLTQLQARPESCRSPEASGAAARRRTTNPQAARAEEACDCDDAMELTQQQARPESCRSPEASGAAARRRTTDRQAAGAEEACDCDDAMELTQPLATQAMGMSPPASQRMREKSADRPSGDLDDAEDDDDDTGSEDEISYTPREPIPLSQDIADEAGEAPKEDQWHVLTPSLLRDILKSTYVLTEAAAGRKSMWDVWRERIRAQFPSEQAIHTICEGVLASTVMEAREDPFMLWFTAPRCSTPVVMLHRRPFNVALKSYMVETYGVGLTLREVEMVVDILGDPQRRAMSSVATARTRGHVEICRISALAEYVLRYKCSAAGLQFARIDTVLAQMSLVEREEAAVQTPTERVRRAIEQNHCHTVRCVHRQRPQGTFVMAWPYYAASRGVAKLIVELSTQDPLFMLRPKPGASGRGPRGAPSRGAPRCRSASEHAMRTQPMPSECVADQRRHHSKHALSFAATNGVRSGACAQLAQHGAPSSHVSCSRACGGSAAAPSMPGATFSTRIDPPLQYPVADIQLDDDQRCAVDVAMSANVTLIDGRAGTGKTAVLASIVRAALDTPDVLVIASAFTARAKERLAEVIKAHCGLAIPTYTLAALEHRGVPARDLAGFLSKDDTVAYEKAREQSSRESPRFDVNVLWIVDEMSMVSIVDFWRAYRGALRGFRTRLVLAGDMRQLPPIQPGTGFFSSLLSRGAPTLLKFPVTVAPLVLPDERAGTLSLAAAAAALAARPRVARAEPPPPPPRATERRVHLWHERRPARVSLSTIHRKFGGHVSEVALRADAVARQDATSFFSGLDRCSEELVVVDPRAHRRDPVQFLRALLPSVLSSADARSASSIRKFAVVTYTNETRSRINYHLAQMLNPRPASGLRGSDSWQVFPRDNRPPIGLYAGDRIVFRKNNYDWNVWNGTLAIFTGMLRAQDVTSWEEDAATGEVVVKEMRRDFAVFVFPSGRRSAIPMSEFYAGRAQVDLGWALTCHAAQGSEFDNVVVVLESSFCNRKWLYTALTRAKRSCVLWATHELLRENVERPLPLQEKPYVEELLDRQLEPLPGMTSGDTE